MKRIFLLLLLLSSAAGAQQLVNCENTPAVTPCNTSTGPSATGNGDQAWLAFGKINADFTALGPLFAITSGNIVGNSGSGLASISVGSGLVMSAGVISATASTPSFSSLTPGTNNAGAMLIGTGSSLAPSGAGTITASALNFTLPIAFGGTGASSATGAINNLLPSQSGLGGSCLGTNGANSSWVSCGSGGGVAISGAPSQYQIAGWASGVAVTGIASGTAGQVFISNGASAYPSYTSTLSAISSINGSTVPASTTLGGLGAAETWTALQRFTNSDLALLGSSTGITTFTSANASATNYTLTIPAATDTVVELAATQTLSNKTLIAPALGTPVSVVLTNGTALPPSGIAAIAAGTVLGNATAGLAAPTAVPTAGNIALINGVFTTSQAINAQTGTTYAIASTDAGKLITRANASSCADTLVQANTTGFTAGYSFDYQNLGSASCTITPSISTINGGASITVVKNTGCTVTSDGGNYQVSACDAVAPSAGAGTVTTTGSPSSGNLTKFSGSTSIVNGDLSGDCTTSGTLAITCTETGGVAFGTSATVNTGTSGAAIPLLNGNNTFSGTFTENGTTNINASHNSATNIGTGTTTGNVAIGNAANLTVLAGPIEIQQGTTYSGNSWTTNGVGIDVNAATFNDSSGSGTITTEVANAIGAPTISTTAATTTITNLANLYLAAPIAGTNVTATNSFSLLTPGVIGNLQSPGANTYTDGLLLVNQALATNNNQQLPPGIHFTGQGWKFNSTAQSEPADARIEFFPQQAGATVAGELQFQFQNNGGGYANGATLLSGGLFTAAGVDVSGTASPADGLDVVATHTLRISSNSIAVALYGPTAFTVSGCGTAGSITANATAGTFTVGTGAATCTFVITVNGATGVGGAIAHGWIANVDDVTAKIHCPNNGALTSTTTATVLCNSTVTTGDLISVSMVPY